MHDVTSDEVGCRKQNSGGGAPGPLARLISDFTKPRVLRIAATWLTVGTAATLLPGCGSSGASASNAPSTSEQAQTRVFAGALNLRAPDLPGFKFVLDGEGKSGPLARQIEECDGGPILNQANHGVASPLLQQRKVPVQTLSSEVYRTPSPSFASGYIQAADSPRGLGCVQREEVRKRDAARLSAKSEVVALRPPLPDALVSGVRIWRCLVRDQACKSSPARSFTDRLWFAAGPYVVTLFYIAGAQNEAKGPEPLALPLERRLIALLYHRARTHKP